MSPRPVSESSRRTDGPPPVGITLPATVRSTSGTVALKPKPHFFESVPQAGRQNTVSP